MLSLFFSLSIEPTQYQHLYGTFMQRMELREIRVSSLKQAKFRRIKSSICLFWIACDF